MILGGIIAFRLANGKTKSGKRKRSREEELEDAEDEEEGDEEQMEEDDEIVIVTPLSKARSKSELLNRVWTSRCLPRSAFMRQNEAARKRVGPSVRLAFFRVPGVSHRLWLVLGMDFNVMLIHSSDRNNFSRNRSGNNQSGAKYWQRDSDSSSSSSSESISTHTSDLNTDSDSEYSDSEMDSSLALLDVNNNNNEINRNNNRKLKCRLRRKKRRKTGDLNENGTVKFEEGEEGVKKEKRKKRPGCLARRKMKRQAKKQAKLAYLQV